MIDYSKAPFPWFGGKRHAASHVWRALGDVDHYVEPFAGSLAVLLQRPHVPNRAYFSETVNDADGLLVNAWRAIRLQPDAVADAASWPVSEADLHARHSALVRWRAEHQLEHLMGDPAWCDAEMAGWWLWGQSSWIGSGWCSGRGPWVVDEDGRLVRRTGARGVNRKLPHLGDDGKGVNRPTLREAGVNADSDYRPMTMPELRAWMRFLSARLRHVRIVNGDWRRVCTSGALRSLSVRSGHGACGVFLDPPYGDVRTSDLYAEDSLTIAEEVRAWCVENGDAPDLRICLAGFDTEHVELELRGWKCVEWFKAGFLAGGMGNTGADGHSQKRERLWFSPHCLAEDGPVQGDLFG